MHSTPLTIASILEWADAHYRRHRRWPRRNSGVIPGSRGENWSAIDRALRNGGRGLPYNSSLARLLAEQRGVRHKGMLPKHTYGQILKWADAHHARTGDWPHTHSGPIHDAPGETWQAVDQALVHGRRDLPGGSSLRHLLAEYRGCRNLGDLPMLTVRQVLRWAAAYRRRTGRWPKRHSGPIPEAPYAETWATVNDALVQGRRGLAGHSSLSRLLARHKGVNGRIGPRLTIRTILTWAVAHHTRTGHWPRHNSGRIADLPRGTWWAVEQALRQGYRGLPGGSSLYKVLVRYRHIDRLKRSSHSSRI